LKQFWELRAYATCDFDNTVLSYYENSHYYHPHSDQSMITALTHFFREPKKFEGGNLYFEDFDNHKYECINNRTIMFNGHVNHAVDALTMTEENMNKGLGRWVMAQFLGYKR